MNVSAIDVSESAATHVGLVRSSNQDSYCCNPTAGVWVVADGMGGHFGGEWASAAIIERIGNLPKHGDFAKRLDATRQAIADSNQCIFDEAHIQGRQMGSTVVALVIGDCRYAILWAGDSRAYLKRGDACLRLTRDHSQAEELVDAGLLDRGAVAGHHSSHILVRAIGVLPSVEVDEIVGECAENDIFMLCSDGLHNLVSDAEIAEIIDRGAFDRVSEQLVELSLERGAPDNITICLARVGGNDSLAGRSLGSF